MIGAIAITDYGWYDFLRNHAALDEVNFWTPSARATFRAPEFSPFLFKLKAPHNAVCGFGFFARYSVLPDWLAWDCFGPGNGCASLPEMRDRIGRIRKRIGYRDAREPANIGCILVVRPTFFPPEAWIPQPTDWRAPTQRYKKYDLTQGEGARVWGQCLERAEFAESPALSDDVEVDGTAPRFGAPRTIEPRLGQGTFRVAVLEAYGRACAATEEHSLPALEAAHIRSFADDGPHDVRNGLLLRADLHRLFDTGYMTVTPDLRIEVSDRLREDYSNGHTYYPLRGHRIHVPCAANERPDGAFLRWHNASVFR